MLATLDRPVSVLIVEDDEEDLYLIKNAFKRANIPVFVKSITDGGEAREMIEESRGLDFDRRPDLIFLDLNLPTVDGRDILSWMRSNQELSDIPIVVLTGVLDRKLATYADRFDDVLCFEKPGDLATMTQIVNQGVLALTSGSIRHD